MLQPFAQGESNGDTDDPQKGGEDRVSEGPAVPIGVLELPVGTRSTAVVDEHHEEHGSAAKSVERGEAGGSGCGYCWFNSC